MMQEYYIPFHCLKLVWFFQFIYICVTPLAQLPRLWKAFARWFWRMKAALAGEFNGQKPNANTKIHWHGLDGTFRYSIKFFCLVFFPRFCVFLAAVTAQGDQCLIHRARSARVSRWSCKVIQRQFGERSRDSVCRKLFPAPALKSSSSCLNAAFTPISTSKIRLQDPRPNTIGKIWSTEDWPTWQIKSRLGSL